MQRGGGQIEGMLNKNKACRPKTEKVEIIVAVADPVGKLHVASDIGDLRHLTITEAERKCQS